MAAQMYRRPAEILRRAIRVSVPEVILNRMIKLQAPAGISMGAASMAAAVIPAEIRAVEISDWPGVYELRHRPRPAFVCPLRPSSKRNADLGKKPCRIVAIELLKHLGR